MLLLGPGLTKAGQEYMWDFFKQNVQLLMDKFGGANSSLFQVTFFLNTL